MMSTFAAPVISSSVAVQTARHAHYAKRIDDIGASRDYSYQVSLVPSRVVLEFGDAISGISRVSGQAARSIG